VTARVLHVIARMNVSGTARYVGELVKKIPNNKLATGFVQGSEIEDPILEKLEFIRIPHLGRSISPISDFRAWLELRKIINEYKPEIVHTHTFKAGVLGRLVSGKHKRVHTFHGHLFDDQTFSVLEKRIIIIIEKFLARRTDLLISVGKKVGIELRAQGVGTNQPWLSIPPGVSALPRLGQKRARRSLGLLPNGFLVGWIARMAHVKNPFLFLAIANKLPEINFVMAGGGELLKETQRRAPKNVSVIGWADSATFWSAVDCAISTSDNEGIPIALIEAQLAGLPVIATNVGSTSEIVSNKVTGILTSKNVEEIVRAVSQFSANPTLREMVGKEGKKQAAKKFGINKMVNTHKRGYERLIGQ